MSDWELALEHVDNLSEYLWLLWLQKFSLESVEVEILRIVA